ncbi:NnrS family protein [Candidatus Magnetaquicoccus inordinatus]|uniref:NnrS family protein n=1 Tax=Candidatus Magnetaquicoccus inordinatus TaxID=2496818 RepID=UPI00102B737E|nr:NnrS family protein [Candidatus Magnetaquicoccus inordinatus]
MQIPIRSFLPADPPLAPMLFSRRPIVHRFWLTGLLAAWIGIALGFWLWASQQGLLGIPEAWSTLKIWHARLQIELFLGSFLLGFALQSGPHVIGGQPPSPLPLLRLLALLQIGFLLSLPLFPAWPAWIGALLVSAAYLAAVYFLARITASGDPLRRLSRGIPLTASFLPMAIAPWLPLDEPSVALWILFCGPVTSALVAAQQLIQNVLAGQHLRGNAARLFAALLLASWSLTTLAAFFHPQLWFAAGAAWLSLFVHFLSATRFLQAVRQQALTSIQLTLLLGFAAALLAASSLLVPQLIPQDGTLHLLGAGMFTLLILGVAARVVSFFSGIQAINDRLLSYLLLLWSLIALFRVASASGWSPGSPLLALLLLCGSLLFAFWSARVLLCLRKISQKITPDLLYK